MRTPSLKANEKGLTITELMVVIAILAALITIAVPAWQKMENRASKQVTMTSMMAARAHVMNLRVAEHKTLPELSTENCLFCRQGLTTGVVLTDLVTPWTADIAQDWGLYGFTAQPNDAWNAPLIADQNEMEYGAGDCRHDTLWSAGPNGIWDDEPIDDIYMEIPWYKQNTDRCPGGE